MYHIATTAAAPIDAPPNLVNSGNEFQRENTWINGRHKNYPHEAIRSTKMAAIKKIKTKPVNEATWDDFEKLFELKGSPHYCWCMVWRMTKDEKKGNSTTNRKKYIKNRVQSQTPIGLLAYMDDEPVGWCSVAPRETYLRLGGDESLDKVWSITCFFVRKEYREQGIVDQLINHAQKYARKNGAKYIEAYPVAPESPSYRFMGFTKTFKKADFKFVKKAGTRRNVMTYKLK